MCPFKNVQTRKRVTPWISQEIYATIREKQRLIRKYKKTENYETLKLAKIQRNAVNSLIYKAKRNYIVNSLNMNIKKPNFFWKIIKDIIDDEDVVDITSIVFRNQDNHDIVNREDVPNYLNEYFVDIASRMRERPENIIDDYVDCYENVMSEFDFTPPELEDMYGYMSEIDINMSSCIPGLNFVLCSQTRCIMQNSLCHGQMLR